MFFILMAEYVNSFTLSIAVRSIDEGGAAAGIDIALDWDNWDAAMHMPAGMDGRRWAMGDGRCDAMTRMMDDGRWDGRWDGWMGIWAWVELQKKSVQLY